MADKNTVKTESGVEIYEDQICQTLNCLIVNY